MKVIKLVVSLAIVCSACAPNSAPVPVGSPGLQAFLDSTRIARGLPALGVAIVTSDSIVVAVSGIRRMGDTARIAPNDRFHLGSNTKAMTATMIARLVGAGVVRWD